MDHPEIKGETQACASDGLIEPFLSRSVVCQTASARTGPGAIFQSTSTPFPLSKMDSLWAYISAGSARAVCEGKKSHKSKNNKAAHLNKWCRLFVLLIFIIGSLSCTGQ